MRMWVSTWKQRSAKYGKKAVWGFQIVSVKSYYVNKISEAQRQTEAAGSQQRRTEIPEHEARTDITAGQSVHWRSWHTFCLYNLISSFDSEFWGGLVISALSLRSCSPLAQRAAGLYVLTLRHCVSRKSPLFPDQCGQDKLLQWMEWLCLTCEQGRLSVGVAVWLWGLAWEPVNLLTSGGWLSALYQLMGILIKRKPNWISEGIKQT